VTANGRVFIGALELGKFGGKRHRGYGHDADQSFKQQERCIF
jgi:hypothetical protein